MAPGLLDMPEVVMSKIMEDTDIKAIFTLRKVCHDLRNFIDDVKPEANLEYTEVTVETEDSIVGQFDFFGRSWFVMYKKHEEGCLVRNNHGGKVVVKNEDFITLFFKDFERILTHQKSVLRELMLCGFQENMNVILWENIQRILKSRVHPLKVEEFTVGNLDQNQIMLILPLLDSKTLTTLQIQNDWRYLQVDQLVKLDHWRNIKDMNLNCSIDLEYIQHCTHFTTNKMIFKTLNFPDLVVLKNMLLQSTGFQSICIKITEKCDLDDIQRSTELLGEPLLLDVENVPKMKWYYRIPATNQVLEIYVHNEDSDILIVLSKVEEDKVLQNAIIHN